MSLIEMLIVMLISILLVVSGYLTLRSVAPAWGIAPPWAVALVAAAGFQFAALGLTTLLVGMGLIHGGPWVVLAYVVCYLVLVLITKRMNT